MARPRVVGPSAGAVVLRAAAATATAAEARTVAFFVPFPAVVNVCTHRPGSERAAAAVAAAVVVAAAAVAAAAVAAAATLPPSFAVSAAVGNGKSAANARTAAVT